MGTIYRRVYRLRRATPKWGIETTIPPEIIHGDVLKPGDAFGLTYSLDGFSLIVPQGVRVNKEFLKRLALRGDTLLNNRSFVDNFSVDFPAVGHNS